MDWWKGRFLWKKISSKSTLEACECYTFRT